MLVYPFLARINGELEEVMPGIVLLRIERDIEHLVHDHILAEKDPRCEMGDERCDIIY
jgi:hypothetical protein